MTYIQRYDQLNYSLKLDYLYKRLKTINKTNIYAIVFNFIQSMKENLSYK